MLKETCIDIGKLLKMADDIHLGYYEYRNRLEKASVPEILVGGDCLPIILSNPQRGLIILKKRLNPFLKFCISICKKSDSTNTERKIYGSKVVKFGKLFEEVARNKDVCNVLIVEDDTKNTIMMEYLN